MNQKPPLAKPSASWLPFAFAILVGLIFLLILKQQSGQWGDVGEAHPAVGRSLSEIQLEPLVNSSSSLDAAALSGKVTLINFWGPWCGPCRMEMPSLIALEKEFRDRAGFKFLSVSCGLDTVYQDLDELRQATAAFAEEMSIEFDIHFDPYFTTRGSLSQEARMDSFAYPTTVLLDEQQVIKAIWVGYVPGMEDDIETVLEGVLN